MNERDFGRLEGKVDAMKEQMTRIEEKINSPCPFENDIGDLQKRSWIRLGAVGVLSAAFGALIPEAIRRLGTN